MFSLWWTRFHRFVVFGPTESFRYNRSIPLGATNFTTVKTVCHLFCVSSDPAPLNESCPLQASHFYHCFVLCLKDQTHSIDSRKPFLEIDVKGGEREITSKLNHFYRGRIIRKRERPQMLGVQEERSHMSLRGERHVNLCYDLCSDLFCSDFVSLFCPIIQYKIQGEKDF